MIVPMHTSAATVTVLKGILGCQIGVFPQTYLEMPLSGDKLPLSVYAPLISKAGKYIGEWQASLLNLMRRAVLLMDTVLNSQLVYAMSVLLLLQGTL